MKVQFAFFGFVWFCANAQEVLESSMMLQVKERPAPIQIEKNSSGPKIEEFVKIGTECKTGHEVPATTLDETCSFLCQHEEEYYSNYDEDLCNSSHVEGDVCKRTGPGEEPLPDLSGEDACGLHCALSHPGTCAMSTFEDGVCKRFPEPENKLKGVSQEECASKCKAKIECAGFDYRKESNECQLHHEIDLVLSAEETPGSADGCYTWDVHEPESLLEQASKPRRVQVHRSHGDSNISQQGEWSMGVDYWRAIGHGRLHVVFDVGLSWGDGWIGNSGSDCKDRKVWIKGKCALGYARPQVCACAWGHCHCVGGGENWWDPCHNKFPNYEFGGGYAYFRQAAPGSHGQAAIILEFYFHGPCGRPSSVGVHAKLWFNFVGEVGGTCLTGQCSR